MDIFLSEVSNKSSSFTFQSLPERIKTKFGTKYQNYDIISKGTVKIPVSYTHLTLPTKA